MSNDEQDDERVAPGVREQAVLPKDIAPAQPVAIDEDDSAQHPPIINRGLPCLLSEYDENRTICSSANQ
uniref:hypothetical protein n=1 Tax=Sphingomonas sp. CFBP 13706 TaxID=2775314 RepID=UPI001FD316A8|nr:hypothetical protein [Sphingomonas sp. CFBP 13706]